MVRVRRPDPSAVVPLDREEVCLCAGRRAFRTVSSITSLDVSLLTVLGSELKSGFITAVNYTECASSPGTYAKSVLRGKGDPGYYLTSCSSSFRSWYARC